MKRLIMGMALVALAGVLGGCDPRDEWLTPPPPPANAINPEPACQHLVLGGICLDTLLASLNVPGGPAPGPVPTPASPLPPYQCPIVNEVNCQRPAPATAAPAQATGTASAPAIDCPPGTEKANGLCIPVKPAPVGSGAAPSAGGGSSGWAVRFCPIDGLCD